MGGYLLSVLSSNIGTPPTDRTGIVHKDACLKVSIKALL